MAIERIEGGGISVCSVQLVEQELWQKEDLEGLIGVVPMHDSQASDRPLSPRAAMLQFLQEGKNFDCVKPNLCIV